MAYFGMRRKTPRRTNAAKIRNTKEKKESVSGLPQYSGRATRSTARSGSNPPAIVNNSSAPTVLRVSLFSMADKGE